MFIFRVYRHRELVQVRAQNTATGAGAGEGYGRLLFFFSQLQRDEKVGWLRIRWFGRWFGRWHWRCWTFVRERRMVLVCQIFQQIEWSRGLTIEKVDDREVVRSLAPEKASLLVFFGGWLICVVNFSRRVAGGNNSNEPPTIVKKIALMIELHRTFLIYGPTDRNTRTKNWR